MNCLVRVVPALHPREVLDPETQISRILPRTRARRSRVAWEPDSRGVLLSYQLEIAEDASTVNVAAEHAIRSVLGDTLVRALVAQLDLGLRLTGYRAGHSDGMESAPTERGVKPLAGELQARLEACSSAGTAPGLAASLVWEVDDDLTTTTFELLALLLAQPESRRLRSLRLGQPVKPDTLDSFVAPHDFAAPDDRSELWSLEAQLAWLALVGAPSLTEVEIDPNIDGGAALGDLQLLVAALPALQTIRRGRETLASRG